MRIYHYIAILEVENEQCSTFMHTLDYSVQNQVYIALCDFADTCMWHGLDRLHVFTGFLILACGKIPNSLGEV